MGRVEIVEAEELGGSEKEIWMEYEKDDEVAYFDKPSHFERSLRHQPNHIRAAKKKEISQEF